MADAACEGAVAADDEEGASHGVALGGAGSHLRAAADDAAERDSGGSVFTSDCSALDVVVGVNVVVDVDVDAVEDVLAPAAVEGCSSRRCCSSCSRSAANESL